MNPIGEDTGIMDILRGLLMLKVFGNVYFRVLDVFWERFKFFRCKVISGKEFGILSLRLASTWLLTELLSLIR